MVTPKWTRARKAARSEIGMKGSFGPGIGGGEGVAVGSAILATSRIVPVDSRWRWREVVEKVESKDG